VYAKARWYAPELGSFLSVDPVVGDLSSPMSLGPYLYGNGNPLRYVDPTGAYSVGFFLGLSRGVQEGSCQLYLMTGEVQNLLASDACIQKAKKLLPMLRAGSDKHRLELKNATLGLNALERAQLKLADDRIDSVVAALGPEQGETTGAWVNRTFNPVSVFLNTGAELTDALGEASFQNRLGNTPGYEQGRRVGESGVNTLVAGGDVVASATGVYALGRAGVSAVGRMGRMFDFSDELNAAAKSAVRGFEDAQSGMMEAGVREAARKGLSEATVTLRFQTGMVRSQYQRKSHELVRL
jgi:hypothetical protein